MIEDIDKVKVLLVDDDVEYVKITEMYLKENGLNIKSSSDPKKALQICKAENIDIVLLDYFMPDITGEEFVKQLREFNNKILVILQTGFADKKPPLQTITELDIQGYHDKTKGVDELLILALSAIKTTKLIKENRMKEIKLNSMNYKKQLIGELSLGLINEAKDQLFSISAANKAIGMDTQEYKEENEIIDNANEKVGNVFSALGFENTNMMRVGEMVKVLVTLLTSKVKEGYVDFLIAAVDESVIVRKNADTIIFLIIETVLLLIKQENKKVRVDIKGNDQLVITFDCDIEYDKEFAKKIVMLLIGIEGVRFTLKDKKATIYVEN
ncbi:MAG: response regulator [Clostridia bacterium]|nr:response regulator [Clostridia bacterium]